MTENKKERTFCRVLLALTAVKMRAIAVRKYLTRVNNLIFDGRNRFLSQSCASILTFRFADLQLGEVPGEA